ncbi:prephenate dehydrogenase [Pseudoxanthomonas broegbernensis]|uniref:Prephenate dehydrogenase n=1 Tax=Pseudoxanthomonas broegbernensis TaxID=83619 RepID=A0A7V8K8U8_9GAMM|nr:prephenate dehydrogenase [Pseudoxanthomonas broegbernensis]KAF1688217.1 prephenate dehydrogenase [Pseudoxanthomonas broegbernensis]
MREAAQTPVVGIVGSDGAYGRWLRRFFEQRMGLRVLGHDPADPGSDPPERLLDQAQVLVFATPIRHTPGLIADYVARSAGRERGRLWLDITSLKQMPVEAMLASQAEVVGLHPMTAPLKTPTLKGRVVVVCEARLAAWRPWLQELLDALQGEYVRAAPAHHDRVMALVQAMVHATHLGQAGVLRSFAGELGGPAALMPYRSIGFEMDAAVTARILSLNPEIYADIQFCNPHTGEMLARLAAQIAGLQGLVERGDEAARAEFRAQYLDGNRQVWGEAAMADGSYTFERVGYLLADLTETRSLSVHLPADRAGSLRTLLHVFERHGISLSSIHSSRTPAGEVHFRIGFEDGADVDTLRAAAAEIDRDGLGRVLESP